MTLLDPFQRGTFGSILEENCFIRTFYDKNLTHYDIKLFNNTCSILIKKIDNQKI